MKHNILASILGLLLSAGCLYTMSAHAQLSGNVYQNQAGLQAQQNTTENVMIILDASYSMAEHLPDGQTKMAAAKRVIMDVLKSLPPNINVGLRIYGYTDNPFTSCNATKSLVPISPANRNYIASQLIGIRPTGSTPISHSLKVSVNEDFRNLPGKKTILLISDGMETCDADPCQVAVDMVRNGVDAKINVVGFGLRDYAATRQLQCVALSTMGKYYSANTAAELARSMAQSLHAQTEIQGRILTPKR